MSFSIVLQVNTPIRLYTIRNCTLVILDGETSVVDDSELLEVSAGQAAPSVPTSVARILQIDWSHGVRYSCYFRMLWHQLSALGGPSWWT